MANAEGTVVKDFEVSAERIGEQCEDILCDGGKIVWAEDVDEGKTIITAEFPKGPLALFATVEMLRDDDVCMSQTPPM